MTEDAPETPLHVLNAMTTWLSIFAEAAELDPLETSVSFKFKNKVTGVERDVEVTLLNILERADKVLTANA